ANRFVLFLLIGNGIDFAHISDPGGAGVFPLEIHDAFLHRHSHTVGTGNVGEVLGVFAGRLEENDGHLAQNDLFGEVLGSHGHFGALQRGAFHWASKLTTGHEPACGAQPTTAQYAGGHHGGEAQESNTALLHDSPPGRTKISNSRPTHSTARARAATRMAPETRME